MGMGSREKKKKVEFISECPGPLIPHHNSVLVISCFSQPDVSKWISWTHPPVIGFWGKVLKLTLEKGDFLSSLIESAVVRVREQGRDSFVQGSICAWNFVLDSVRSLKAIQPVTVSSGNLCKSLGKIDPGLMGWFEPPDLAENYSTSVCDGGWVYMRRLLMQFLYTAAL